jgi:hypothetical protein
MVVEVASSFFRRGMQPLCLRLTPPRVGARVQHLRSVQRAVSLASTPPARVALAMADPEGDRDVGSEDEADGELKKAEDAYANECNAKPLNSRNI